MILQHVVCVAVHLIRCTQRAKCFSQKHHGNKAMDEKKNKNFKKLSKVTPFHGM